MSGVTPQTWENMIIDSAVAYVNYGLPDERILGATNGGITFGWEAFNVRTPEIDGLKGRLAGVSRITEASPQIVVNLVEFSLENFQLAFPGIDVQTQGGFTHITRSGRVIPIEEYPENLAMVGTQSGTGNPVIIMIKRPMVVSGAEIPTADDSEATAALTFVGHYDPSDPEVEPWEIIMPNSSGAASLERLRIPASTTIAEDAASASVVAVVTGQAVGSTITVVDPRFEIVGDELRRTTSGVLAPGNVDIIVVEALAGAYNSPRASSLRVTVTEA